MFAKGVLPKLTSVGISVLGSTSFHPVGGAIDFPDSSTTLAVCPVEPEKVYSGSMTFPFLSTNCIVTD